MANERINALLRAIREEAQSLPAGKRRDVNNKLERIELNFRRAGTPVPVTTTTEEDAETYASQAKSVLAYMREGHTITSLEGLRLFGIISFPRRILDIEKMTGIAPKRKRIKVVNRYGKEVSCNEYWWEENDLQ